MKKAFISLFLLFCLFFSGCGMADPPEETSSVPAENGVFEIRFFDVGQADSILICCDGESMLIDGGNIGDGGDVVTSLLRLGLRSLDVVVCTHSDEDHIGGLPDVLDNFEVNTIYTAGKPADTKIYERFCEAAEENGADMKTPVPGRKFPLGKSTVTFLGPVSVASDPNDNSIVLRIDYGETSYLFTGDATQKEEKEILETGADLSVDVLKVGHHGGEESTSYVFLREVMPSYAVISVGDNNKYGHPTKGVLSRLRDAKATVYRTDKLGEIICSSDGKEITFSSGESSAPLGEVAVVDSKAKVPEKSSYIGNINSKKFHSPDCPSLPEKQNAVYFATREEALMQGYEPCGRCKP